LVWYFQAKHVAKMKYFYEKSKNTRSVTEVAEAIEGLEKNVQLNRTKIFQYRDN